MRFLRGAVLFEMIAATAGGNDIGPGIPAST